MIIDLTCPNEFISIFYYLLLVLDVLVRVSIHYTIVYNMHYAASNCCSLRKCIKFATWSLDEALTDFNLVVCFNSQHKHSTCLAITEVILCSCKLYSKIYKVLAIIMVFPTFDVIALGARRSRIYFLYYRL
jgi:hypothetical protein